METQMQDKNLTILVEGKRDGDIVQKILLAANYPQERINVIPFHGIKSMLKMISKVADSNDQLYAVLLDLDASTVFKAQEVERA
jgi:5S rRNA maturation endonuclease (ribonuclease M5)